MITRGSAPLFIPTDGLPVQLHSLSAEQEVSEADIQRYIQDYPSCLPIAEIDSIFAGPVAICTELSTPAGPIDNFMVTPSGLPVLVECKLWRNPEARREVVGQILDYAKELSHWSSSDLQRAVRQRLKCAGDPVLDAVRKVVPETGEIEFNDSLTRNLRRGRFLLLIVGDGIREGVETISEYLQAHAGLHFSLGLIELPTFVIPDVGHLVVPRVLARTTVIAHRVVQVPDGFALAPSEGNTLDTPISPERSARATEQQAFWKDFLDQLKLDDPEQPRPQPARQGYLNFMMPAPGGSSWIGVFRNMSRNEVGVELASSGNEAGTYARRVIAEDWPSIKNELGGTATLSERDGRPVISDRHAFDLTDPSDRQKAYEWLAERLNMFVNVLRPRVRSAVADYQDRAE